LKTTISESDKVDFFVKNMYDSGLYEAKFLEEWEASVDQSWKTTRDAFTKEYGVITRATNREAQRSGYESADALGKHQTTTPITVSKAATSEYDAMLEYVAALEEQLTALQTTADGAQSVISDFASSASTVNSKVANATLLKEMGAERKQQAGQM
jgi:hypothetical protein